MSTITCRRCGTTVERPAEQTLTNGPILPGLDFCPKCGRSSFTAYGWSAFPVQARFVQEHQNVSASARITGYWTPCVEPTGPGPRVWPCSTRLEAEEMGTRLIAEGLAREPHHLTD